MKYKVVVSLFCLLMVGMSLYAQDPNLRIPRDDDHFWRRKIVNRIDFREKMNAPLVARESHLYANQSQYSETEGLVMALFNGLKEGKFVAYHPDSLKESLSYEDVINRIQEIEGSLYGDGDDIEGEDEDNPVEGEFSDIEGEGGWDDGGSDDGDGWDDGGDGWDDGGGDTGFDDMGSDSTSTDGGAAMSGEFDPAPFENVIQFVEDQIFDKSRSDMVYNIEYIQIIWTDPGETLPDKYLCTFKYSDVVERLEGTQWKNNYNDAEYRSLKEVFDLRMFHSFIVDVSGRGGITSLEEAEQRRQQLVEFEHHLWSY